MYRKKLSYIYWDTTNACNLACIHCRTEAQTNPSPNELTTNEIKSLIDQISAYKPRAFGFDGGEPLLRKDLFEIISYVKKYGILTALVSNGTLIDKNTAKKLKNSGLDMIAVSIDGYGKTHDKIRGKDGAFDLAIQGLKNLKAVGLLAAMRITIMKPNLKEIPDLVELAIELGLRRVLINKVIPTGRARQNNLIIGKNEYIDVLNTVLERAKGKIEVASSDPITFKIFRKDKEIKERYGTIHNIIAGCIAGIAACHITATGDVLPCAALREIIVGNIREKPFEEIWEKSDILEKLRESNNLKGKCGKCSFKHICGGCRAYALYCKGDLFAENPICLIS